MRFSTSGFFHESVSPRPPKYSIEAVLNFFENSRKNIYRGGDKLFSGVNDTGEKFEKFEIVLVFCDLDFTENDTISKLKFLAATLIFRANL